MRRVFTLVGRCVLAAGLLIAGAQGQVTTSTVSGTVRDKSGAVIPSAQVTATNRETGSSRSATSDSAGRYLIPQLEPGNYSVTASASGFAREEQTGVALTVGHTSVVDFTLDVGAIEQKVEVTAAAPVVETSTASIATLVGQKQVEDLPLNGRSFTQLAALQAGVITATNGRKDSVFGGQGIKMAVAGSRLDANAFLLDGSDVNDQYNKTPGSIAGVMLGVDTVREFQVLTSNYSAEYGRVSGGVINAITRSGTNARHGSAFEFLHNSALDARNFFDARGVPPFRRNQFGGTLDGPIRRDQSFFLVSYEGLRQGLNETFVYFVPDDNARRGILPAGQVTVAPAVVPYLALFPRANGPSRGGGVADFISVANEPTREDWFAARLDHGFSENDKFFLRYTFDNAESTVQRPNYLTLFPEGDSNQQHFATLEETHIFSPTLLNTLRWGLNRQTANAASKDLLPIPRSLFFIPGSVHFGLLTISGLATFGPDQILPIINAMTAYQVSDNLTWVKGAHTLKLGGLIERFQWNNDNVFQADGNWSFPSLENFLAGGPSGVGLAVELPNSDTYKGWRLTLLGSYLQDDFRWRPNFTWNLGFRYEITNTFAEVNGKSSHLLDARHDAAVQIGAPFQNPSLFNFAPRIGLAWSPGSSAKTVVSGAFGVYYDQILNQTVDTWRYTAPFYGFGQLVNVDARPIFPNSVAAVANSPKTSRIFDFAHTRTPMVMRYNFGIQRQIAPTVGVRVTYVGARSNRLLRQGFNNDQDPVVLPDGTLFFAPNTPRANPNFEAIPTRQTDSQAFYNSFQLQLNKQMSHGLMLQANYTLSKSIDDNSAIHGNDYSGGCPNSAQYGPARTLDRGLSCFDTRHALVINSSYQIPLGTGHPLMNQGAGKVLLGNWEIRGIFSAQTGAPFSVSNNSPTAGFRLSATRPNLLPGHRSNPVLGGPDKYYDASGFAAPAPGFLGNLGRDTLTGPGLKNFDFSLAKRFTITERTNLEFRSEFFNVFNHANFAIPDVGAIRGGRVSPTAGRITKTTTSSRQIQFALKFSF